MKFCAKCGVQNEDAVVFCSNCGNKFEAQAQAQPQPQPQPQQQPQQPQQPQPQFQQQPQQPPPFQPPMYQSSSANLPGKGMATASMIFGIFTLILCWWGFTGYVALVLGIIGIITGVMSNKKMKMVGLPSIGMATAGLVMSIIGTIFGAIFAIACTLCSSAVCSIGTSIGSLGSYLP